MYSADATLQKVATAAFFDELAALLVGSRSKVAAEILDAAYDEVLDARGSDFVKQASDDDLEELIKVAVIGQLVKRFPVLGMPAGQGLRQLGSQAAAAARPAVQAVHRVTAPVSRGAGRVLEAAAHPLQQSKNQFVSGVGNALHHKAQTAPIRGILNAPGTAVEAGMASAGHLAAPRLAAAGGALQNRFGGAALPTSHPGWAQQQAQMMRGGPQEALRRLGGTMQTSFAKGGTGHRVLTQTLPHAAEIATGGGLGAAGVHTLPGMLGGAALGAVGSGAKTLGLQGVTEGLHHFVGGMGSVGELAHHGVADVVGSHAQDAVARRITTARGIPTPTAVPPRVRPQLPSPQPVAVPSPA